AIDLRRSILRALQQQTQRGEPLAKLVVQVASDAPALVLLRGDDLPEQADDIGLCQLVVGKRGLELEGALSDTQVLFGVRMTELFRGVLLRRQVAGDLGESQPRPRAQTRRDGAAVEERAIVSDVMALVNGAPGGSCPPEFGRRYAGRAIGLGEQRLEVASDDLVGAVAEHALRAGVPRVDGAVAR